MTYGIGSIYRSPGVHARQRGGCYDPVSHTRAFLQRKGRGRKTTEPPPTEQSLVRCEGSTTCFVQRHHFSQMELVSR